MAEEGGGECTRGRGGGEWVRAWRQAVGEPPLLPRTAAAGRRLTRGPVGAHSNARVGK